jgi:hypothetical protein
MKKRYFGAAPAARREPWGRTCFSPVAETPPEASLMRRRFLFSVVKEENMPEKKRTCTLCGLLLAILVSGGCISASQHAADVQKGLDGERLTVGNVQREIHTGMSGAEVAQVLGSPNIVSTDEKGREVWIYDRIATDRVHSSSYGGINALVLGLATGGSSLGAGLFGGSGSYDAGASSTSQRTLTVIVKFDEEKKVRDFAYHSSRF